METEKGPKTRRLVQPPFDNSLPTATVKQLMLKDSFSELLTNEQFVISEVLSMSNSKYTGQGDISGNILK